MRNQANKQLVTEEMQQLVQNHNKFNQLLQKAFQSQLEKASISSDEVSYAQSYLKQIFPNIKYSKLIQLMYKAVLYRKQIHFREEEVKVHKQITNRPVQSDIILYANLKQKHKFKSFQDLLKFSQRVLTAKVLCVKGYGTNTVRQYTDSFRCPIQIQKNNYNTFSTGAVTAICRKIQWFIVTKCKKKIQPFNQAQIRALHTPLQNYRLRLDEAQGYTFQKFIKATFNLSTVIISINQALRLYVTILRACRDENITQDKLTSLKFVGDTIEAETKQDPTEVRVKIQNLLRRKRKPTKINVDYTRIDGKQVNIYQEINQIMPEEEFQIQDDYYKLTDSKSNKFNFYNQERLNQFGYDDLQGEDGNSEKFKGSIYDESQDQTINMSKDLRRNVQKNDKKSIQENLKSKEKSAKQIKKEKKEKKEKKKKLKDKQHINNQKQQISKMVQMQTKKPDFKQTKQKQKQRQRQKSQKPQKRKKQKKQKKQKKKHSQKEDNLQQKDNSFSNKKDNQNKQKLNKQQQNKAQQDNNEIDFDFNDFKVQV